MTDRIAVPAAGVTSERLAWWGAGLAVAAVGWGAQQFAPLLLLYQAELRLSSTVVQATFGLYVLGLIPGLLLGGPVSDRYGRRRVMVPTLVVSVAGTVALILGGTGLGWLFAGRLLAGAASGAAFSSGAAWIKELGTADGPAGVNPGPRRLTVTMSVGFGLGPLVAGAAAQWAPAPTVLPYLPHLVLAVAAIPLALRTRETRARETGARRRRPALPTAAKRRFRTVVVPLAPWVFGSASIALAYLPGLVKDQLAGHALIFSAVVTLLTAGAGIAVQPLARRLDHGHQRRLLAGALGIVVAGLLVAVAASVLLSPALVVLAALVLGAGYGCCQVCGLLEVQRLAPPEQLAGLTASYQAVSYLGFLASFALAAGAGVLPPSELLVAVAVLAALTLVWTTWQARLVPDR
ncbi:MAG TPA: MFS transporter [Pseudonocardia sp.]|nr:MFS transporter [Pseudonocardia sp.]